MTRIAVALGGNALIQRGEPGSTEVQRHNLGTAARALVDLAERSGAEIVLTHGNGPQVGFLAIAAEMAADVVPAPPLDVLGAESQGQIGYLMSQALNAAFLERGIRREIAVIVSQVVVQSDDPAFAHPTKPVGPIYDEATAREHAETRGWAIAPDGKHWRRVVPSPKPLRLVEASSVRSLVEAGILVVASGGGGIPVAELPDGRYEGREAVIDKDLAAVVLARAVGAQGLLLLTDVDAVYRGWGTPESEAIRRMSVDEAFEGLAGNAWPAGSMGPKIRACAEFIRGGGSFAAIGRLEDAAALAWGRAGTRFGSGRLGLPPFTAAAGAR
ncbi:MAG TPA: carbamate kinase [Candidatus Nanopelagicales bacterium]|nr:carbamate kinase [Candidatus Nanopelagicales bacterium]